MMHIQISAFIHVLKQGCFVIQVQSIWIEKFFTHGNKNKKKKKKKHVMLILFKKHSFFWTLVCINLHYIWVGGKKMDG